MPDFCAGAEADAGEPAAVAALRRAQGSVDAAYALHDTLYAASAEQAAETMATARTSAEAAIAAYEAAAAGGDGCEIKQLARIWYMRGKAAACSADGRASSEAERLLADAVKADPSLLDAWNCLGECYWARDQLETARGCFAGALETERNAASLCHLSQLLRQLATSSASGADDAADGPAEAADEASAGRPQLLAESISLAKEAVRLSPRSASAWKNLANAQLCTYTLTVAAEPLHLALKAFTQAREPPATATTARPPRLTRRARCAGGQCERRPRG